WGWWGVGGVGVGGGGGGQPWGRAGVRRPSPRERGRRTPPVPGAEPPQRFDARKRDRHVARFDRAAVEGVLDPGDRVVSRRQRLADEQHVAAGAQGAHSALPRGGRSEERRVGKEWGSTVGS